MKQANTTSEEELDEILAKHGAEAGELTASLKDALLAWRDAAVVEATAQAEHKAKEAVLKARREIYGSYLFMMDTHDFGRPFTFEEVVQITKDSYAGVSDELLAHKEKGKQDE